MLTEKQIRIFEPFVRKPFTEYTLKQIKELSREKSNNALNISMKKFKKEILLIERKVGKSSLYKLNFDNDLVYYYMALCNQNRLSEMVLRSLDIIKSEVERFTSFYSLIIFGSYAIQQQRKESDLDIAIFIENKKMKKYIEIALNSASLKSLLNLDSHIITKDEMIEMLKVDYENLGKEIMRKHMIVHNQQIFYNVVLKEVKNGF